MLQRSHVPSSFAHRSNSRLILATRTGSAHSPNSAVSSSRRTGSRGGRQSRRRRDFLRRTFKSGGYATASQERSGAREFRQTRRTRTRPRTRRSTSRNTVSRSDSTAGSRRKFAFSTWTSRRAGLRSCIGGATRCRSAALVRVVRQRPRVGSRPRFTPRALADLSFERLLPDVAVVVAGSPHLAALTHLSVNPLGSDPGAIRSLVSLPAWPDLRTLRFTGRLSPEGVRELATLYFEASRRTRPRPRQPGHTRQPDGRSGQRPLRSVPAQVAIPGSDPPRWVEFGPALEALAAAKWMRGLPALQIASGHASGLLGMIGERLYGGTETVTDVIPDAAVLARSPP